jgi:cytoskeletal protein CcmA (bactofilin family)
MAIFGKKPESSPQPQASAPPSPPPPSPRPRSTPAPPAVSAPKRSFLGPGCELEGDFKGAGSFECRGTFNGTIDVEEDLVIGQGGVATAQLKARRITIEGRLEGNATGSDKVEVGASGHVEGDVRAPAVQFAEGAFFEGNVEMRRAQDREPGDGAERRPAAPTDASGQ